MSTKILQYLLCFGVPALISLLFMPQIYSIAKNVKAIDDPNESERKIHTKKIPRLGGLVIYLAFLLGYTIFGETIILQNFAFTIEFAQQMESLLIASFIIVLMGIFDDISPVSAKKKLFVQIIAALIVVVRGNFIVWDFDFIIDIELPQYVAQIFTVLWIVTITNAINFSDGLDGLAGGLSFISLMTMAIIGMIDTSVYASLVVMITLLLSGAIFGFLPYNLPPAKIFMGDSGSQFIGFMIGTLSVLGYKQAAFTSFLIPVVILALPIFDLVFAFFRRVIKRMPASTADANHVHHRVFQNTESQKASLYWIYGLSILFSASAISYSYSKSVGTVVFLIAFIAAELFIEYFYIISVRYTPLINLYCKIFPNSQRDAARKKKAFKTIRYQNKQKQQVAAELSSKNMKKEK